MAAEFSTLAQAPSPPYYDDLRKAVGCFCEVRNPNSNQLIFLSRVQRFDGNAVTVVPTGSREAPPVLYNTEYKLVLRIPNAPTLVWRGMICGSTGSFWKLDRLTRCHHEELRKSFRQTVQKRTNILCLNALYPGAPTKSEACYARMGLVLDISLGGLQLQCEDSYAPGDHLAVMNLYLDPTSSRPFLFTVQVRWTSKVPNQRLYRCGCSFEPMSVQNEDRLCAAILNLQRADIAAH